jgi:membrane-bound lytic murein transglycosylase C
MHRIYFFLLATLLLTACSREFIEQSYSVNYEPTNRFARGLAPLPGQFEKDTAALDSLISSFTGDIEKRWGANEIKVAGRNNYVKYIDDYQSRADVNFDTGTITIETIASSEPLLHLKRAITTTLLTPDDPIHVDLFSSQNIELKGQPFLYQQVVDHEKQPIQWTWRATRFADYLLTNKLQVKQVDFKKSYYVVIPMVADQVDIRGFQYANIIRRSSKKYGIDEDLIYAIIKTESSFNPYAVSWANAYGLMQVVPDTAGRDVFEKIKQRSGQPSPEYLYNPENNIDAGTAYFYILKHNYLKDIIDPLSLEYSMISAYNGGAGGVLDTFNQNRVQAISDINRLKPNQVYWALTNKHAKAESRRYLQKVLNYKKQFNSGRL